ncbi:MAG: hypothetical protein ACREP9_07305 [Candidatus Dormibacteraceae bacterium]
MKRYLEQYVIEITLVLLGATAAIVETLVVHRSDIAALMAVVALLLALAVAAIRQEIRAQIGEVLIERQILHEVPDPSWRKEAEDEIEQARLKFASWAGGTRRVDERSSLNFQIESLRRATSSVRAIHLALESDSLTMWDNRQRGFSHLVEAYRQLPDYVHSRRILVLDVNDPKLSIMQSHQRIITDEVVQRVCHLQMRSRAEGGLGFDLRIAWQPSSDREVSDLLVIDEKEVCSIESYGHGHFGDLEVSVNSVIVGAQIHQFEDLWTDSTPARHCLPPEVSASAT